MYNCTFWNIFVLEIRGRKSLCTYTSFFFFFKVFLSLSRAPPCCHPTSLLWKLSWPFTQYFNSLVAYLQLNVGVKTYYTFPLLYTFSCAINWVTKLCKVAPSRSSLKMWQHQEGFHISEGYSRWPSVFYFNGATVALPYKVTNGVCHYQNNVSFLWEQSKPQLG